MEDVETSNDVICFECKKNAHIKPNCPLLKKTKVKYEKYKKSLKAKIWSDIECEENEEKFANICLMVRSKSDSESNSNSNSNIDSKSNKEIKVIVKRKSKWYLDSGYSKHMIGDSSNFAKLEK